MGDCKICCVFLDRGLWRNAYLFWWAGLGPPRCWDDDDMRMSVCALVVWIEKEEVLSKDELLVQDERSKKNWWKAMDEVGKTKWREEKECA